MTTMTTRTRAEIFYGKLASNYGVDPLDTIAVEEFFNTGVDALPMKERLQVINDLLRYDGTADFQEN